MSAAHKTHIDAFMQEVARRHAGETEFIQAVQEFAEVVIPFVAAHPEYKEGKLLERLVEPERIVIFRVPWVDDSGEVQINRGYRVQMSSSLGPYKGGLRFHPSVNLSILKFLAFEQTFKNALTTLPLGSGKGGSDFNPKGKSEGEVMRFCQSFMAELYRHVGQYTDVPAGDIGVGGREIGYMFGQYKRLANAFTGILTGKGLGWGGSVLRTEATGYGCVYFSQEALRHHGKAMEGQRAIVSGSGNVAQYTVEKLLELGVKVHTLSDSSGYVYDKEGFNEEKLSFVKELKNVRRGRIHEYAKAFKAVDFVAGKRPWQVPCDLAYPCATQNELQLEDARTLHKQGCIGVFEGANMPVTPDAVEVFKAQEVLFSPGKASNAGGVATSGLEMSQNSERMYWERDEVDTHLRRIMKSIHENCVAYGASKGACTDYVKGANIAGFIKVAHAMRAQGVV